jgi:hypothetical protein
MYQKPDKTNKNRKKPVETKEIPLTKARKESKVNCGTVLRTRVNIDDLHVDRRVIEEQASVRRAGHPD